MLAVFILIGRKQILSNGIGIEQLNVLVIMTDVFNFCPV